MEPDDDKDICQDIRMTVIEQRYLQKDSSGRIIETPEQMFRRVADTIAAVEVKYGATADGVSAIAGEFYKLMANGVFIPNSPTLMNAGRKDGLLSACFVLSVPDSIEGIFDTIKHTALIQKAGGGTGFSFDQLRPTGDIVASSGGRTSGPISFMKVLAEATRAIQQGAFRRGANMGMMSIEHPDILRFITVKRDLAVLENFNLSVKVSDAFMNTLNEPADKPHIVVNPRTGLPYVIPKNINLANYTLRDLLPADQVDTPCYTVQDIWELIIAGAHATGEPGLAFMDRINRDNPIPHLGRIEATNPCGEQPLLSFEACNLGSLNVARFVQDEGYDLDWQALGQAIRTAVRCLDNVIDANDWPIPQIGEITLANRKIGLGIMGFADALILLGIRYDSDDAVNFTNQLSGFIQEQSHQASRILARERGSFPSWQGSIWDTEHHLLMRNAAVTTIAPTGSISIIADCSSGIEPIFKLAYRRRALDGQEFVQLHPLVRRLGRQQGWLNDETTPMLIAGVPVADIPGIPSELAQVLVTAHEIAPEWHVRIQAAIQSHTDNAVSKTVNLPADATTDDVDEVFRRSYRLGCKGATVYRDNSRGQQVLSAASYPKAHDHISLSPRPRTRITTGNTSKFRMGCGTLFVTVNKDDKGICEVFANLGKAGGCPSQSEATCRAISAALRSGVDPQSLIEQLKGIRCLSTLVARKDNKGVDVLSCPDAIARAIEEAVAGPSIQKAASRPPEGRSCPFCSQPMRREAGCFVCDKCMFSSCG